MSHRSEVKESLDQYIAAWSTYPRLKPTGEFRQEPGLVFSFGDMTWSLMNCAFVTEPATTDDDWERRATRTRDYFRAKGRAFCLLTCEDWVTPSAKAVLARLGLEPVMTVTGMAAEKLVAPVRPLPPELTFRRVDDPESRQAIGDLNTVCYAVPTELGREVTAFGDLLWREGDFAYLGCVDGKPVTCSVASRFGDCLYVSWVATLPEHRKKGYAEAVMRQGLTEAARFHGITRTTLHATEAGFPVYQRMGYHAVTRFIIFGEKRP